MMPASRKRRMILSIRLSAIRFSNLPISTSKFTRSKNFSRSTSTTVLFPAWM
jgi:hypothetical protein